MVSLIKKIIYILAGMLIILHLITVSGLLYSINRILVKTDRIYEYFNPANLAIARLEAMHEIRLSRLLAMIALKNESSVNKDMETMQSSAKKVAALLEELQGLDHMPREKSLIDKYIKMRGDIVSLRDEKIVPIFLEGRDSEALEILKRDFMPIFEVRRNLALDIQDHLAEKNEEIHREIGHMLRNTGVTAVVVLVMTILGAAFFCYIFTKMVVMQKQKEKQEDQMLAMQATMNRVQDVVLNALNQMQFFSARVSDENNELSKEDMEMFQSIIDDTAEQIRKIGNLEKFETDEITKGMTTLKTYP